MQKKVLLILADGLRPDAVSACQSAVFPALLQGNFYTPCAETVFPSVTLPCHLSLFLSVPPERHGVLTNTYTPPVRPVDGLFEQIKRFGGTTAMFYDWEPLRDLSRPGALEFSHMVNGTGILEAALALRDNTDAAIAYLFRARPDFAFLYYGLTDEAGHKFGFMSEEYLHSARTVLGAVSEVLSSLPAEYRVIFLSDHGGHDRIHGTRQPEDMTIPLFCHGPEFGPFPEERTVSILDVAPTVAELLEIPQNPDWEGRSFLSR